MGFPKLLLDPQSIEPMLRNSHFSGATPVKSKITGKKIEYLSRGVTKIKNCSGFSKADHFLKV
jgi:hypothetical protein